MKSITIIFCFLIIVSCSKSVDYSSDHIEQTSGRYLFAPDEVLEVYYENKNLFLKWRGSEKIRPVILDQNTFFVADMYKKLRFVKHPDTNEHYLTIVNPDNDDLITYDYLKLSDSMDIPSEYLKKGNYDKALIGYLKIQEQDSTSWLIDESEFNRYGYTLLGEKKYQNAIDVFKINVVLYPKSSNVYDSLADAFLRSGDSIQAFNNYKIAFDLNNGNRTAEQYINAYSKKIN